jgi:hypothetical protein
MRFPLHTEHLTVRLPIEDKRAVQQVARGRGEPLADLVRRALAREVAELRAEAQQRRERL